MMGDSERDETAKLMAELEGLSDEEAQQRLLAEDSAARDRRSADACGGLRSPMIPQPARRRPGAAVVARRSACSCSTGSCPGWRPTTSRRWCACARRSTTSCCGRALDAIVARHEILRTTHPPDRRRRRSRRSAPSAEVELDRRRPALASGVRARRARPSALLGELACRPFDLARRRAAAGRARARRARTRTCCWSSSTTSPPTTSRARCCSPSSTSSTRALSDGDGAEPSLPELPIQYADFARVAARAAERRATWTSSSRTGASRSPARPSASSCRRTGRARACRATAGSCASSS